MNLLDANSVVSTLGLIGVLGIIFMETGLLIGLVFPGGEVVFLAGFYLPWRPSQQLLVEKLVIGLERRLDDRFLIGLRVDSLIKKWSQKWKSI